MHGKGEYFPEVASYETFMSMGFNYFEPTWCRRLADGTDQTIYHGEIFKYSYSDGKAVQIVVAENRKGKKVTWQLGHFLANSPEDYSGSDRDEYFRLLDESLQSIEPDQIEARLRELYEETQKSLLG